ncbi:cobyric acid synthase [Rhodoblastus acidophilus]|uniref:Cobyric acid synthase n=1 Tax=Rhodoblastus acidophilus TaxID=1074 RepID=A0A6N8DTR9_RHOAC|nr:cobyric acid synthase [Rhodoblastus acidophilus]MCW2274638.1 adenosylcobyric acid synthase [Rhodoblastus acidophilus]MTV32583.1 cobyric acid synthase [Rhodoblastus acidophilus]
MIPAQAADLIAQIQYTPRPDDGPRRAKSLMIQGTSSDVGKSMVVAGLCRAFSRRGLVVRPFKAQNMSNNAAVAANSDLPPGPDGLMPRGEIGRAQALQARACFAEPSIHMNPVLLKPQSDIGAQVVLRGRVLGNCPAKIYHYMRRQLMPAVVDSFERLARESDLVIVEGAGSGAEAYLRSSDITNMRFAEEADLPVIFLSDIDRGGTMGAIVGTWALLSESDRARVVGYIVNKFRGDFSIFEPGCVTITEHTNWPFLGVLRWFPAAERLPAEDSLALERAAAGSQGKLKIAVLRLQRVANFDDLDPLVAEPDVDLQWIQPGTAIPGDVDVVIIPGSKSTRTELDLIKREGWDIDIRAHVRRGGRVLGLCAGYQILGRVVRDPQGIEGPPGETEGLGLLDLETEMSDEKRLVDIDALDHVTGVRVTGYEMHMGRTTGPGLERPWMILDHGDGAFKPEGAVSPDGRVVGAYVHGVFGGDAFRSAWLKQLGAQISHLAFEERVEHTLEALADHIEANLDLDALLKLAR